FTQTTTAEGRSTAERSDAGKPAYDRWSLVQVDGRSPTASEVRHYDEQRSRRSNSGTPPKIGEQFDLATLEIVSETEERAIYRCALKPSEASDKTAKFLRATITVHKPTQTIEAVELGSTAEFSPAIGVKIAELKTTMLYSIPTADTPSFPQKVVTRQRGTAFWFKALDAEMTVVFSDFERARKK
ncbi:MAG TPA: hypothetical protein VGE76_04180, partial [Opitutaceae bacterium]